MKDCYLRFENPTIEGESGDAVNQGWIEIDFFKQHMIQPRSATASTAGGLTCERCEHSPVVVSKLIDKSSPKLYEYLSSGKTFEGVTLQFYRADDNGTRVMYQEIKLKNVIISSIISGISENFDPYDEIELTYAAIQWKHIKQSISGGIAGNTQCAWSLTRNEKTFA